MRALLEDAKSLPQEEREKVLTNIFKLVEKINEIVTTINNGYNKT